MRKLALLALAAASLAGCGGGSGDTAATTSAATATVPTPSPGRLLYGAGRWAVTIDHGKPLVLELVQNRWRLDSTKRVRIDILGPKPHSLAASQPQLAVQVVGPAPLVESGIWVDGTEIDVKGGGLDPKRGTIYGTTYLPLKPGRHVAIAYGRTATTGTAVTWPFRTR